MPYLHEHTDTTETVASYKHDIKYFLGRYMLTCTLDPSNKKRHYSRSESKGTTGAFNHFQMLIMCLFNKVVEINLNELYFGTAGEMEDQYASLSNDKKSFSPTAPLSSPVLHSDSIILLATIRDKLGIIWLFINVYQEGNATC
ncbi:hypothetical protein ACJX0J_011017, partial [Zea mays]